MKKKRFLGFGFVDEVVKVSFSSKSFKAKKGGESNWKEVLLPNFSNAFEHRVKSNPWRSTVILSFCLMIFFVMLLRLFHLQIVKGSQNRNLADSNRIQVKVIHAPRGVIYDRNAQILAANSPAFRLFDKTTQKSRLITREEALELEVENDSKVTSLEIDSLRTYPMREKFAHVVGYVGEISPKQLENSEFKNYHLGDRIGQVGIEAQYEKILKGVDGGEIIEVDSKGIKIRTLRTNPPIPGQNIYLTLDSSLQDILFKQIEQTLTKVGSCCGAAIAMEPNSGQVLALVSLPSFDPNIFTQNQNDSAIAEVFTNHDAPILNRVTSGTYPPGSTFKIVSSVAALASGKIKPNTIFEDNGVIYLGTFKFTNWYFTQYGKTEGSVNLVKAIQRSNDTYFYQVGQTVGEKALSLWAKKLMLGQKLGIDLPGEEMGLVPDNEWKVKNFGQIWYPGDTLHMAIGQGFLLTTPLQILGITSYIAADGVLYKPQLVKKVTAGDVGVKEFKSQILAANLLPKDQVKVIKEGLKQVPKVGGTAWPFFTFPINTAGKTGTAEYGDPKDRTHAWYTSFAPVDDPKIALTILIEGGGEGSNVAAPIAKETYRWYLSEDKNKLIQDVYNQATDSGKTLGE